MVVISGNETGTECNIGPKNFHPIYQSFAKLFCEKLMNIIGTRETVYALLITRYHSLREKLIVEIKLKKKEKKE